MVYGPRWEFPLPGDEKVTVIMRPARLPADAKVLADLMCDPIILNYVHLDHPPSVQEELEFLTQSATDENIHWIVAVRQEGKKDKPIGITDLYRLKDSDHSRRLTSGIILADHAWWGQGIASATHRLRTWHAFANLGMYWINSSYATANEASGRALANAGYFKIGREPRSLLWNGCWHDVILLNCLNPAAVPLLFPNGHLSTGIRAAISKTQAALDWAAETLRL